MPLIRRYVVTRFRAAPLPPWATAFDLLYKHLAAAGLVGWLKVAAAFRRQGGYVGFDLLLFGLAYFLAPPGGGFKAFWQAAKRAVPRIAKLAERQSLPSTAAVSRMLAAADRMPDADSFVASLPGKGCDCAALLRSPLAQHRDAQGQAWSVFDVDPTVHARRLRALPEGADLADGQRRSAELCAPGYTGRKRGETQFSTLMVSHAGTGLWTYTAVAPGNTPFAAATASAAKAVVATARWADLDLARLLLRFDGAGGHHDAIAAVVQAAAHYLTRLASCRVLEQPGVIEHLAAAAWGEVPDSGSGPRRYATELGTWALSKEDFLREVPDQAALRTRLVVSRFLAAADGKKRGAGVVIGPWQYEVFATDLEATAWPAHHTVTLYYGRCGQENSFATSYDELRLGDVFAETLHGQRLMTAIGMWVANLRRVVAAAHKGPLGPAPDQERQPPEPPPAGAPSVEAAAPSAPTADGQNGVAAPGEAVACDTAVHEVATDHAPAPESASASTDMAADTSARGGPVDPAAACTEPAAPSAQPPSPALQAAVLAQVPATVRCPRGLDLPLLGIRAVNARYVYANYGGPRAPCADCSQRSACTHRSDIEYRRTMSLAVPAALLPLRHAIAAHYRAAATPPLPPPPLPPLSPPRPTKASAKAVAAPVPRPAAPAKPPRLALCSATPPGPWLPQAPSLYMPALLRDWKDWVAQHTVDVRLSAPARTPTRPWVRETPARRQCRRKTEAERLLYNASRRSASVTLTRWAG